MERFYLEEVDSTNKYVRENLPSLKDRSVIYTYKQTCGRGRLNRRWNYTGSDNIYATIVLKPSLDMKPVYANLTQLLCEVLAQVFEEYGVVPQIKWPNDIRINSKKISGILAETVFEKGNLTGIALGFGVNLNCSKADLDAIGQPATALNAETGLDVDKEIFLKKVLMKFDLLYDRFIEEGFLLIRENYLKRFEFLNKDVTVKVFDKEVTGKAINIDRNGALEIVDKFNNKQILLIGDIL